MIVDAPGAHLDQERRIARSQDSMEIALTIVAQAASSLGLLDSDGRLVDLDSVMLVDLLLEIETKHSLKLPLEKLSAQSVKSVDAVAIVVAEAMALQPAPARPI
jgi:acyl carrier protein